MVTSQSFCQQVRGRPLRPGRKSCCFVPSFRRMFEITGDDIALLSDTDLRSVVGRLCEAELRRQGASLSHVTWGGSQTAKDAGLDVHVSLPAEAEIKGFIPKRETG